MAQPYQPTGTSTDNPLLSETAGTIYAVLALAQALERKGALSLADYRAELSRLWDEMPQDYAESGAGLVFETLLERLNAVLEQRK